MFRLHPDFETWEACFDYVTSTGPLPIVLPGAGKTNLELMRFLDALRKRKRKRKLELVDVGDKPGHYVMCTPDQAPALKGQVPAAPPPTRNYLPANPQSAG